MPSLAWADGKVVPPRNYKGSLEEKAQEAMIVFHGSDKPGEATQDLILKIRVEGDAGRFAWIVPFPNEPKITKEDPRLFKELFDYVEARKYRSSGAKNDSFGGDAEAPRSADRKAVEVLSRKIVGDFDVAVVRENEEGGLNPWLEKEGFQTLDDADDVLDFYREKKYVYACMKVSSEALTSERSIESHPLRFTFKTGGRDGVYFPMKMTSLQTEPFDVNLYVFYRYWINDKLSQFGYRHRGFSLRYRDWDTAKCVPNGGKAWSLPSEDPFLSGMSRRIPTLVKYFQKLHPGQRYYLTNIQVTRLKPADVREWPDDLWLFPYYTNRSMIPYDARPGGPASAAWPNLKVKRRSTTQVRASASRLGSAWRLIALAVVPVLVGFVLVVRQLRQTRSARPTKPAK